MDDVAAAGGLPLIAAEEMGYGPEAGGTLKFEVAATTVEAERGALDDGAGPDEFLCTTAASDCPFLSIEGELFALEAAGFGEMRALTEYSKCGSVALLG